MTAAVFSPAEQGIVEGLQEAADTGYSGDVQHLALGALMLVDDLRHRLGELQDAAQACLEGAGTSWETPAEERLRALVEPQPLATVTPLRPEGDRP